jgi:cytidylate kinase
MAVITISRGTCSGGKFVAEYLAHKLGYRCIDRDQILDKAATFGVSEEYLRAALEKPPASAETRHARYVYLAVIQAALAEEVKHGRAVYHGLAGQWLLKDARHVLRVRLIAPLEFRLAMVQDRLKLPRKEAIAYIHRADQERCKWTRFLFGADWEDPANYDVVLNLDHLNIEQSCEFIYWMLKEKPFQTNPEHMRELHDLAVASRIRANLALDPATADLELEIAAHGGVVAIKGRIACSDQATEIARVARAVRGAREVELEGLALAAAV